MGSFKRILITELNQGKEYKHKLSMIFIKPLRWNLKKNKIDNVMIKIDTN